ncbi:nucleotidyl transferase AbiEii/AbiGii toxin family protein [Candidatus Microgenomates bacterium]|nr:nucleotidyl transferase AbiEii/AbiGii toxin family protein [Candidatus Microgenomates bacterium]
MGKIQFQTKEQQIILDEISKNEFIRSHFYFTGGTALSSVYLHHRYSDDLDLFSEEKFDNQTILTLVEEWGKKNNFTLQARFAEVVYIFNLTFKNKARLKVDFGWYPYKRLNKEKVLDGIEIDSLLDIAVNKLLTVSQRSDVKDFVDLYFLLQKFTIWDLIEGVRIKFRMKIEPLLLAADLLKIDDFKDMPRMIKLLSLKDLQAFYKNLAKKLGMEAVEK